MQPGIKGRRWCYLDYPGCFRSHKISFFFTEKMNNSVARGIGGTEDRRLIICSTKGRERLILVVLKGYF